MMSDKIFTSLTASFCLGRSSNYDVRDLDNSNMQDVESELNNMLGQI
jgi:hypothetical protein